MNTVSMILGLGLRLLTAVVKVMGCTLDLMALSSAASQRACILIHKHAMNQACNSAD
jgi:hypothetical protein